MPWISVFSLLIVINETGALDLVTKKMTYESHLWLVARTHWSFTTASTVLLAKLSCLHGSKSSDVCGFLLNLLLLSILLPQRICFLQQHTSASSRNRASELET